jgi:hypothetical protein
MVRISLLLDFVWGLTAGLLLVVFLRPYWGVLYTDESDVQNMIYKTLPIMLLYCTVDSTKCITLNILRSTGRPGITVIGNVFACLAVMLPLGYYLGIERGFGLFGLWGAMSFAWFLATVAYFYVVVSTDWQVQADDALQRNTHAKSYSGGNSVGGASTSHLGASGLDEEEVGLEKRVADGSGVDTGIEEGEGGGQGVMEIEMSHSDTHSVRNRSRSSSLAERNNY